jgi:ferritin
MLVKSLLKPQVSKWFDKSVSSELYASNLYKHIANQLQRLGYFGTQKFFLKESAEELEHYQKLVDYVNDMGSVINVPQVPSMTDKIDNIMDALELAYNTELDLMNQYHQFYEQSQDDYEDCITATFLIEFLQIQRKSVGQYGDLISRFEKNTTDVFEFDHFMKKQ